jgi:hypothetical protein
MGILDEAIREHLALKRRQGSLSDDELKRLEDEAFGPPTRPGEPDFPAEEGEEGEPEVADERGELPEGEGPALEEASGQPSLEGIDVEPIDDADEVHEDFQPAPAEEQPEAGAPATGEAEASVRTAPPTGETEVLAGSDPEAPEEREGGEGSAFYDHAGEGDLDFGELELELDDEIAEVDDADEAAQGTEEADAGVAPGPPTEEAEPPIESLDTVEHPVDPEEAESDEFQFEEAESEELEQDAGEPDQAPAESHEREQGEDVLEETPEFLRDAPEDDELWFEQGEPKDFDF